MRVDYLIIGQGLAGSTLAIELLRRGRKVVVVDRGDVGSSSRIAAGLITPLTGKGMNPAWRQREYLDVATQYYRRLEGESGRRILHSSPVMRFFLTEKERLKWESKGEGCREWARDVDVPEDLLKGECYGAIEMQEGAWLDTLAYLEVVRSRLEEVDAIRRADFSEEDVCMGVDGVAWQDVTAEKVILCQGAYGLTGVAGYDGWFSGVSHRSAKGEILSLQVDGVDEGKRYHGNGWLAPRGDGLWKAGASYVWDQLDSVPTEVGKEEVLGKLGRWISDDVSLKVVGHEAGIRPIIRNSRPVVGFHREYPRVGFFNGLGSKGALMAPAVAAHFAAHLCGECELDEELSLSDI